MSDVAFAEPVDPRLDFVQAPVTPLDRKPGGYAQNVWDELQNSWWMQGIALGQDFNLPRDPDFDPLDPALIKGKEPYAQYLAEARSRPHFDAIWTRLQGYEERRARLAQEGGLASALTAGIIDPSNLIPLGVVNRVGALRGALMGGASTGAVVLGTQMIADQIAPVSTEEKVYSTLLGIGLGSVLGGVIGRNVPDGVKVSEFARTIETQSKILDDAIETGIIANPNDRSVPTAYVARPSQANATGIAPAFGLEKIVGKLSHFGELVSSGFRAFEDLGNALAGEMDALFNRNRMAVEEGGGATQQSASLRALYWQGKAGVLLRDLESIYARYLGGGDQQMMLGGLNVPMAARRLQQAITGRGPAGKMTINEFHTEVSRAHKRDKIDAADPFVKEAVDRVRAFYDEMREAGLASNMIMTPENLTKLKTRMTDWVADKQGRLRALQEKEKLTANEKAERKLLERAIEYGLNRQKIYEQALGRPTPATAVAQRVAQAEKTILRPANDTTLVVDGNVVELPQVEVQLKTGMDQPGFMRAANDSFTPFVGPENEKYYLNRIWALDKVMADEAGPQKLRAILEQWYRDNPLPVDYDAINRAERIIDDILKWVETPRQNAKKEELLAKLEELYATRGLTEAQIKLLDGLKNDLAAPGAMTPAQRSYVRDLAKKVNAQVLRQRELAAKAGNVADPRDLADIDAQIAGRVDRTIAHILKTAELGEYQVGRSLESPALARDLNIPNELVWDFIEDDVSVLIRSYAQRMGMAIEYGRMFGSRDAELAIYDAALQASREAKGSDSAILKRIDTLMDRARAMRDNALGDSYAANPLSLNRRIVQTASAYSTITTLGGAMITSLSEVMKPLMIWGFNRSFSFALQALNDREGFRAISRDVQQLTAGGLETALHMHVQRYGEQGGVMGGRQNFLGRMFDKGSRGLINFANGPYFAINLLGPFTDILKNYSGVMSAHFLIDDAVKIAAGQADDKLLANFRALGLDIEDAKRIAAMPFERDKALNLTNIAAWDDPELVRRFGAAVAAEQRRAVVTAGQANLPDITRGFVGLGDKRREFAYLRLPFMLMNFAFASVNKTMLSALQGRDANALMGGIGMLGAAYMVNRLKTPDSQWEKMEDGEKLLRAVENSGLLAIFGDLNSKVESLTRSEYGARASLGLPPRMGNLSTDAYEPFSALGPLGSKGADLYQLLFEPNMATRDVAKTLRRSIPGQDLFYLKGLLDQVERGALEY